MGPAQLCLTQHVSLQTSELSAQLGRQQRPRCHFAECAECVQSLCQLFSHSEAQKGDHPTCQEALRTAGLRSGVRSTHQLWAQANSPSISILFPFFFSNPMVQDRKSPACPQGLILRGVESSHSVAIIVRSCEYLTPCSISSLWLNSVSSSVCGTPITQVRVSSPNQHSYSDLYWCHQGRTQSH